MSRNYCLIRTEAEVGNITTNTRFFHSLHEACAAMQDDFAMLNSFQGFPRETAEENPTCYTQKSPFKIEAHDEQGDVSWEIVPVVFRGDGESNISQTKPSPINILHHRCPDDTHIWALEYNFDNQSCDADTMDFVSIGTSCLLKSSVVGKWNYLGSNIGKNIGCRGFEYCGPNQEYVVCTTARKIAEFLGTTVTRTEV